MGLTPERGGKCTTQESSLTAMSDRHSALTVCELDLSISVGGGNVQRVAHTIQFLGERNGQCNRIPEFGARMDARLRGVSRSIGFRIRQR